MEKCGDSVETCWTDLMNMNDMAMLYKSLATYVEEYKGGLDCVLDVGAHMGIFSCLMAEKKAKRIHAFEPYTPNFYRLCKNIQYGNFETTIIPYKIAVMDKTCQVELKNVGNTGMTCATFPGSVKGRTEISAGLSFEEVVAMTGHVDLMKMDIEGTEYQIFMNTRDSVFDNVENIIIEFHDWHHTHESKIRNYDLETLVKRIGSLGYYPRKSHSISQGTWFTRG